MTAHSEAIEEARSDGPISILERNQEKGPQKVREQGCGKERDWLETGACIDWLKKEEEEVGLQGKPMLGPRLGIQLHELWGSV